MNLYIAALSAWDTKHNRDVYAPAIVQEENLDLAEAHFWSLVKMKWQPPRYERHISVVREVPKGTIGDESI